MRKSRLRSRLEAIEDAARFVKGPNSVEDYRRLRRSLLRLIQTGTADEALRKFAHQRHGLVKTLDEIEEDPRLAALREAVYRVASFGSSVPKAIAVTGTTQNDYNYALHISSAVGEPLAEYVAELSPLLPWIAALHHAIDSFIVVVSQTAAEDMVLASLEGHAVPHPHKKKGTEVYGLCMGTHRRVTQHKKQLGIATNTFINIVRCPIQLRAIAGPSYVLPNDKAALLQMQIASSLYPYLTVIGDYHSHPYGSIGQLIQNRGWCYSKADQVSNKTWVTSVREAGHDPLLGFVVAVATKEKAVDKGECAKFGPNTHQMTLGRYQVIIAAYAIDPAGNYHSERVYLSCTLQNLS